MVIEMKLLKWLLLWPLVFGLAGCSYIPKVIWVNAASIHFELYDATGNKLLVVAPGESSPAWKFWDAASSKEKADWPISLQAGKCFYNYKQPDSYAIRRAATDAVRTKKGWAPVSPFLLVVDPQFVIHFEYPKNWRWDKPPIAGFPAVPSVTCQ